MSISVFSQIDLRLNTLCRNYEMSFDLAEQMVKISIEKFYAKFSIFILIYFIQYPFKVTLKDTIYCI